jgi:hypothetical protein
VQLEAMGEWHAKGFKQGYTQKKNRDKPRASLSYSSEEKGYRYRRARQTSIKPPTHQHINKARQ